ncbi:tRNA (cytosine(32)/uridine(32)-2'-O)-methyltransferase TrmJ [Photorhabdus luminescens]|uniref:tRNA (cytidine/uridine-2'-O-)-methyltransferase TrmJ n=2 Tax=Photorhabdus TaxID=29487 RepID=A0A2S8PUY6_9GAMM|nr:MULTISPECIES: tRNA (cytosine(32)/uridine(32)-2'-O)-methyltransferase TrmJ [Photorhabdus]MBS9434517.1 tRNA (cytosine(32)/uridine(32)-2'-O)-methyltransferase TrmJ [Photorhabdus hainanensis]PQQ22649.1 tRNA (cytosine(32)/uridine(32)-2'-O)-methyltransferase TrmJ [Photorhabdus hindustanensis]QXF34660.1 tRNA (cytosine(32)/uridine(32)-2'-O)-methyltransferase TrmJ [Photorhabdus akhurstii]UJD76486.1 tRNA (cytosine(32)/uridine(32)-2'-O)-methyltransferase TrmJ [Photorhabdus luminescens]
MLENIRIILVETSHTGNMGSTARAMKTMGLTNLYLVNPLVQPDSHAIALSAGASDVIGNATMVDSLDKALAGCGLVIGTSARSRTLSWPMVEPRECGERSVQEAEHASVAIVFGRERVGLTNEELQKCHYHLNIPTNPDYGSLNLAMAVQLVSYEIRMAYLARQDKNEQKTDEVEYPLADDMERFYHHLERVLNDSGFIRKAHPGQIMNRLRRLFTRARPEMQELNILRGILSSVEKWAKK